MVAVDIAQTFIKAAQEIESTAPLGINFRLGDATDLAFPDETFAFATAFMSLMDASRSDLAIREAFRVLKPGGFLQFSILRPCFAPPGRRTLRDEQGNVYGIQLADYFKRTNGEVETSTFGAAPAEERARHEPFRVPRFHRTLGDWMMMLIDTGFNIEAVTEPMADLETAERFPDVADTRVTPVFLHIRARKPI